MDNLTARHTQIEKVINTTLGNVVLESPTGYPRGESNLYCVASDGTILWFAVLPEAGAFYVRAKFDDQGEKLLTYSIRGHACEIDLKTGALLSQILIK